MTRTLNRSTMRDGLIVDLFAGGGGASTGIEAALGRPVDIGINHDPVALAVHKANHPRTHHIETDIWEVKPQEATGGRPVAVLWASPDCTHFSIAKGGKPRKKKTRSLAWTVVRWAEATRPAVIFLENVTEFKNWGPLTDDGRIDKRFLGRTFRAWRRKLEKLGYVVDFRTLDASLYGAPTKRRRLFLIARCDGLPIEWPECTHGKSKRPVRTAAECIDWALPCPSIFERKKPLADKTMWRIAQGIKRFVLDTGDPFIVKVNHGVDHKTGRREHPITAPLKTITAGGVTDALVSPTLIQTGYGERRGQAARVPGLHKPLGTLVAGGTKHALVSAFLAKHYGGVVGHDMYRPIGTVTATDHHSLAAATLIKFRGTAENQHATQAVDAPMPTLTAGGNHVAEVRAFLTTYYGTSGSGGQALADPVRTLTSHHRHGLVTVKGVDYAIADIGMRMLQPHELLIAQFGKYAAEYDMSAAKTKTAQVRLIGNSVCPEIAEAIVRANLVTPLEAVA